MNRNSSTEVKSATELPHKAQQSRVSLQVGADDQAIRTVTPRVTMQVGHSATGRLAECEARGEVHAIPDVPICQVCRSLTSGNPGERH
jgi:hypothetical protein